MGDLVQLVLENRAVLQGSAIGLFMLLGLLHPRVTGQSLVTRDTLINLGTGLLMFGISVTVVAWIEGQVEFGAIDISGLPTWGQWLVAFVALDFARYWVHYADHRVPFLWQFHRVHHSVERMDATAGLRMHVVDFFQLVAIPIVLFTVLFRGYGPLVVPGALAVGIVFDAFQHSNIAMDSSKPLFRAWNLLLNNPHFHSWHHTRDGALCDGNYGNTLLLWDRLFRTEVTQPLPPALYGLEDGQALQNSLVGLQLLRRRDRAAEAA